MIQTPPKFISLKNILDASRPVVRFGQRGKGFFEIHNERSRGKAAVRADGGEIFLHRCRIFLLRQICDDGDVAEIDVVGRVFFLKIWYNEAMETLRKKSLFWDVEALDPNKDGSFIIGRILHFGDTDDFAWAMRFYGREQLEKTLRSSVGLDSKSLSFWCQFFNIDKATCTKNQSTNQPSAFSQR